MIIAAGRTESNSAGQSCGRDSRHPQVYIAGSRITQMYPFGPLPGCAAKITLLSHDGTCCIGMNTDTLAITDPGGLADDLQADLKEVVALQG